MKGTIVSRVRVNWVVMAVALAALLQVIFAFTYPLDSGASDNPAYLEMIRTGTSNVILASGYPFVMHTLLSLFHVQPSITIFDAPWLAAIQIAQNLVHFYFLVGFAWLASRAFGQATAGCFVVLLGCATLFLGGLNSAAPEWLQGDLIALSLLVAANSFVSDKYKVYQYGVAFALITLAYLVKPNSLIVVPLVVALVILDRMAPTKKLLALGVSGLLAGGLLLFFVTFYHGPSTGTRQLNYAHAWVLTAALPDNYFASPSDELGLNALRWRALSALVPPAYSFAAAYPTMDTGAPPAVRMIYLQRYREVMQLPRAGLVEFVAEHPLPSGFRQGVSAIPLYWYVGFKPIDDLGIEVYGEALVSRWPHYLEKVVSGLGSWGVFQADIVPFESQPQGLLLGPEDVGGLRHYTVPQDEWGPLMRYWNPAETVWAPGMRAMEWLSGLILPRFVEICLVLLSLASIAQLNDRRGRTVAALIVGVIVTFAISSYVLVGVRDKEQISLMPTVAMLYAFGLSWLLSFVRAHSRRWWPKRDVPRAR